MKRKVILVVLVFLFNIIWVNAISVTNKLASSHNIIIRTIKKTSLNNNVMDDLDIMLETSLVYEGEEAIVIGNKINANLKAEMSGYGELIAKYSIANNINPYLIASMIIYETECDEECSVLVTRCNNVAKILYDKELAGTSCFGGSYQKFDSIENSIKTYIKYIKVNFYDKELTTPSNMYKSYRKDVGWAFKINQTIDRIKNTSL